jgi:hypothetical protein
MYNSDLCFDGHYIKYDPKQVNIILIISKNTIVKFPKLSPVPPSNNKRGADPKVRWVSPMLLNIA